ncbi:MAG: 7TM diverse intracellular signaling domain-containing protein [Mucilaginibacter sp.]|uniref:7TM diverse intracellular signaling domain-containing protein n=1 Tax=Mucilaginibacter sp. TaxID=1882438 RepID=UPI0032664437
MSAKKCGKAFFTIMLCLVAAVLRAQQPVVVNNNTNEHIFHTNEVEYIEDPQGTLTIQQVSSPAFSSKYQLPKNYYGVNYNIKSVYWYRIKLTVINPGNGIFEFFDQTIDDITAYLPTDQGGFLSIKAGAKYDFTKRLYQHKNFEFPIKTQLAGQNIYYFRVRSSQNANVIIVYRTIERFIQYALTEYLTFGFFYGMIMIFSFHNLLMFIAIRRRQYLVYVLYILSVGLYEMSVDGIAFQYIWPNYPAYNEFAFGIPLFAISTFALIFTRELLHVKAKAPKLDLLIKAMLALRAVFFIVCLFNTQLFNYKIIEIIPLTVAFFTGIYVWKRGFRPARFFVLGYAFLFAGFIVKLMCVYGYAKFLPGVVGHYSLGFSFILEMVFLSFAIGDQVRILKKKKEKAQQKIMEQMALNVKLKDSVNRELEIQVAKRTKEVVIKSNEVFEKSAIIEAQNNELQHKNLLLEKQSEEISRMNVLLEKDNISLKSNIETVNTARTMLTELSFEEFSIKYPDQESCYKFLAELKWQKGYTCTKCGNDHYSVDDVKFSRRCTKCRYVESALYNTIFENNKIPLNKAFYLVYLMYFNKGTISSPKLSEKLEIRQSTCWAYSNRVKKVMDERKKELKSTNKSGWSSLILK